MGASIRECKYYVSCSVNAGFGCHLFQKQDSSLLAFVLVKHDSTVFVTSKRTVAPCYGKVKCGFPLAKVRKKRKTFFSHTSGSLGASVRGYRSHGS